MIYLIQSSTQLLFFSENLFLVLNVQFDYNMPVLCTDLGIFQFYIFGNDTNKANIRKILVCFVFFMLVRNTGTSQAA